MGYINLIKRGNGRVIKGLFKGGEMGILVYLLLIA